MTKLSPAVEYLESDEYLERQQYGRNNFGAADHFGHPDATVIIGSLDTHRRPMFEVLEDHPRRCGWTDCLIAKHRKEDKAATRRGTTYGHYTEANEQITIPGNSVMMQQLRRIVAEAYEIPATFLSTPSRVEVNGVDLSDHISSITIN